MTDQSNAAAERSAHVERGPARRPPGHSFLAEVSPGVFKLKAVAEAERERDRLREALRGVLEIDGWSQDHPRYLAARAALGETNRD